MKKIPTLFVRDESRRFVTLEVTPGCEWVLRGEGRPTVKRDGTCVMLNAEGWWARREVKPGKPTPPNFRLAEHDEATGKSFGWVPMDESDWLPVFESVPDKPTLPGTYELCGPKVNGNPEGLTAHHLFEHGAEVEPRMVGVEYADDIQSEIARLDYEGIVWHHADGRMAKLKKRDIPKEARGE